jgi:ribose transport system substrate-binding protein
MRFPFPLRLAPEVAALVLALATPLAAAPGGYEVAVVPMGSSHAFWKAIHAGADKAGAELTAAGTPVKVIWKGPFREDDRDQQVEVVENFVGRQVSGIVLAPIDSRALVRPVEEAVAAGIPVVIVNSPLRSRAPSSLILTDNREGGRLGAHRLGQLLHGRGRAILLRSQPGADAAEQREAGFLEGMRAEFPGIELVSTDQYAGPTRDTARRTAENLLNRFGARLDGVFAANESSACGMLLALRDAGLAGGRVKFVGFDSGDTLVEGLRAGDIQGLVVQDPFAMGYLGVKSVVSVLRGGRVPALVRTRVTLVTLDNLGDPAIVALLNPR